MWWKCHLWERFFNDTIGSLLWFSRYSELIQIQLKPRNPPLFFLALWDLIIFKIFKQLLYLQLVIILWAVLTLCVLFSETFTWLKGMFLLSYLFSAWGKQFLSKKFLFLALWDFPDQNRIKFQKKIFCNSSCGNCGFRAFCVSFGVFFGTEIWIDFVFIC